MDQQERGRVLCLGMWQIFSHFSDTPLTKTLYETLQTYYTSCTS